MAVKAWNVSSFFDFAILQETKSPQFGSHLRPTVLDTDGLTVNVLERSDSRYE